MTRSLWIALLVLISAMEIISRAARAETPQQSTAALSAAGAPPKEVSAKEVSAEEAAAFVFSCSPAAGSTASPESEWEFFEMQAQDFHACVDDALRSAPTGLRERHPYAFMDLLLQEILATAQVPQAQRQLRAEKAFDQFEKQMARVLRRPNQKGDVPGAKDLVTFRKLMREVRDSAVDSAGGGIGMFVQKMGSSAGSDAMYAQAALRAFEARRERARRAFCDWKAAVDRTIAWEKGQRPPRFPTELFYCRS